MPIRLLGLIALVLSFTSCGDIQFERSMPPHTSYIPEMPVECRGSFSNAEGDTVRISRHTVDLGEIQVSLVKGDETFTLKAGNDWYFGNVVDEEGKYYVVPFRGLKNGNLEYGVFVLEGEDSEALLQRITPILERGEGFLEATLIDPNAAQFDELVKSTLLETEILQRIPED